MLQQGGGRGGGEGRRGLESCAAEDGDELAALAQSAGAGAGEGNRGHAHGGASRQTGAASGDGAADPAAGGQSQSLLSMRSIGVIALGQTHLFYGVTIAIFSLARLLCMPLLGLWSDRRPMREAFVASILLGMVGNAMYACAWGADNAWLIMFGRVIVGMGAANGALSMSYITRVSRPEDRTSAIALMNGINLIGIVVGPATNLLVADIEGDLGGWLVFNKYTNAGWLMVVLLSLLLLLIFVTFEEPDKMAMLEESEPEPMTGGSRRTAAANSSSGASVVSGRAESEASFSALSLPSPVVGVGGSPFFAMDNSSTNNTGASNADRSFSGSVDTRSPGLASLAASEEAAFANDDLQEPILGPRAMHELEDFGKGRFHDAYRILVGNKLWVHFVVSFCSNFVLCELEVALPAMTGSAFGWDTFDNSIMYAFIGLFVALNLMCVMMLSRRVMDRHFIACGLSGQLVALSVAAMSLRDAHPPKAMFFVVLLLLIGACPMTGSPNMGLYTKRLAEDETSVRHLGLFIGLLQTVNGLSRTIAPVYSGLALSAGEDNHVLVYVGPLAVVGPSLLVFWFNYDSFRVKSLAPRQPA